jgi:Uri superfamily endonuclease
MDTPLEPSPAGIRMITSPGTYALVIQVGADWRGDIGALKDVTVDRGWYTYVGSAHRPGGLGARVGRHLRPPGRKNFHWHIDRVGQFGRIRMLWLCRDPRRLECDWAQTLARFGEMQPRGFGASDCDCAGHLLRFRSRRLLDAGYQALEDLYHPVRCVVIRR